MDPRAAHGAILITTKKGKIGKTTFDGSIQYGVGKVTRKIDMMNTQQYLEMRNEALKNDGILPNQSNAPDLVLWDTTRETDWQKELLGGTANFTTITTGLSGGFNTLKYLIRGSYQKETTVLPGTFF